jgi:uracil-DNA glycosylase
MAQVPTPDELRDLLAMILAGAAGGDLRQWLEALGPVEKLPTHFNVRSNWAVHPRCPRSKRRAIDNAIAIVREAHPYVAG